MISFREYMAVPPDFEELIRQADEAMAKGRFHIAWELVNQAEPRNEDEASLKTMYLDELRGKQTQFLTAMKKGQV